MDEQCCMTCAFYNKHWDSKEGSAGECRRYPPTPVRDFEIERALNDDFVLQGRTKSEFPSVESNSWCGEWKEFIRADNESVRGVIGEIAIKVHSKTIVLDTRKMIASKVVSAFKRGLGADDAIRSLQSSRFIQSKAAVEYATEAWKYLESLNA